MNGDVGGDMGDPVISCKPDSIIRCRYKDCNAVSAVKELEPKNGPRLQTPGKDAQSDQTAWWYCRSCNDPYAKVFDWGNGNLEVVPPHGELVQE